MESVNTISVTPEWSLARGDLRTLPGPKCIPNRYGRTQGMEQSILRYQFIDSKGLVIRFESLQERCQIRDA